MITNLGCQWAIAIAGKDPEFVIHRTNSFIGGDATSSSLKREMQR
jgi:hypothetical protein